MTTGEALRNARENAGLSIDDLASRTSIRPTLLKEMEKNNFDACGGDTYARGHIRNIAPLVNESADNLIEMYNLEHSSKRRGIHDLLVENSVTRIPREKRNITWKSLVVISLVTLSCVGVAQVIISNSKTVTPLPMASATPSMSATAPAQASPIATPEVSTGVITGKITLVISATRGNSNIDVVDEGNHLYKGPIFQGDVKTFTAASSISIYLSNAGDLDLTLNGEELAPLGASGEVVRKTFRSQP